MRSQVRPEFRLALLWLALSALLACRRASDGPVEPGGPLPDLSEAELGRFLLGKALFERLTVPEEGLGPLYNAERCSTCHAVPASGGSGPALVLKATRVGPRGCDRLEARGGDNIQRRATPLLAARGIRGETLPPEATHTARLAGPPLFGLGLVEAVPERAILQREDPGDADHDGISGRAARTPDGRLARFGRQGEAATVREFVESALLFELGLTTPDRPAEELPNGRPLPPGADPAPDPELDARGLELLTDYLRFLAPPAPRRPPSRAARDSVARGERLFQAIGCAFCHLPLLRTGPSEVRALDRRPVAAYSDFLLHDLGPELAGVCSPTAGPTEYRTAPLWGLRYREAWLHDGRARSVRDAIVWHGGEAEPARERFRRLSAGDQALLLAFLSSL